MSVYATGRVEQFITDPITGVISTAPGVKGISINTTNSAISEYLDYPFNSFATLEGKMLGANENGLYLLEGDDDDGTAISASFRLVLQDFGVSLLKRLKRCYLGIKFSGKMIVKAIDEKNIPGDPRAVTSISSDYHNRRVKFAKGPRNRYWAIDISNDNGEDFTIDTLELAAIPTERRMR